jgi:RNA polymerase sigma factor (sigma-70 family)
VPSGSDSPESRASRPPEPEHTPAPVADPAAARLIARVVAGESSALGELYDRFGMRCYALARRLLGEQSLAEDAVQEAFLALWRAPERFDAQRGTLATFLLTLTHRRAVDVLRREALQRRGRVASDEALVQQSTEEPGPEQQAESRMEGAAVREALRVLPQPQREVLQMAYYQGYTQREIASLTGAPLGTVKTRMLAGVRSMRTQLAPQLGPHGDEGVDR